MAFAKQIAERVGKVTHDGSCRGYALVAAPRFLGMLREFAYPNHSDCLDSSKEKIRSQSFFMLTTCHPPDSAASSDALSGSA